MIIPVKSAQMEPTVQAAMQFITENLTQIINYAFVKINGIIKEQINSVSHVYINAQNVRMEQNVQNV